MPTSRTNQSAYPGRPIRYDALLMGKWRRWYSSAGRTALLPFLLGALLLDDELAERYAEVDPLAGTRERQGNGSYRSTMTMTTMSRTRPKPPPIYIEHSPFWSIEDSWTAPTSCWNDGHQLQCHKLAIVRAYFYRRVASCRETLVLRVGALSGTNDYLDDHNGQEDVNESPHCVRGDPTQKPGQLR